MKTKAHNEYGTISTSKDLGSTGKTTMKERAEPQGKYIIWIMKCKIKLLENQINIYTKYFKVVKNINEITINKN